MGRRVTPSRSPALEKLAILFESQAGIVDSRESGSFPMFVRMAGRVGADRGQEIGLFHLYLGGPGDGHEILKRLLDSFTNTHSGGLENSEGLNRPLRAVGEWESKTGPTRFEHGFYRICAVVLDG